jgi:hypothetical protein
LKNARTITKNDSAHLRERAISPGVGGKQ